MWTIYKFCIKKNSGRKRVQSIATDATSLDSGRSRLLTDASEATPQSGLYKINANSKKYIFKGIQ